MSQSSLVNKHNESLILSTDVPTQYAQVVCNPDGSNVGASVFVTSDTELSTAAALSDAFANPTTSSIFALTGLWNGATWDRAPGDLTDGLLVNLGSNNDITGTVTANAGTDLNTSLLALESGGNLAGAATSLAILDDWDESDRAKVNPIVGQAGVSGGSGTVDATTQRVVLATDVALPSGTNAIGKLVANDGVDIGDVTINNLTTTPVYTQSNITGIGHGNKTVATAGTDEALAGSTACKKIIIEALSTNTGQIAVGGSGVDATAGTGTGITLSARDSVTLEIDNLADVYIDSTVNGEGVRYTYFT